MKLIYKIQISIKEFYKLFFLTRKQKTFIKHNRKLLNLNKNKSSDNKIVLIELNELVTNTIAFSYFAFYSAKKYDARLSAYFPRIPRSFYKRTIWKMKALFGSPGYNIFKSFGVETLLVPSLNSTILKESTKIYNDQLKNIKSKDDVEQIKINGILFGDLIYDYYLNYYKLPSIDFESNKFKLHLRYCIQLITYWNNYFIENNVAAINVSHTVYTNAIPLRIAANFNVHCFQCNESYVYRLDKNNVLAYKDFIYYKKSFALMDEKEKTSGIKLAKKRIDKRFSGEVGVDMAYSKKSAFTQPVKEKLLSTSKRIKILIAPHCFFDSPHPYGLNLFPDVFEWLKELVRISSLTDYEWYVKTHPDFIIETKTLVEDFFQPHQKFKILPSNASHIQLVEEGIDVALTMYGTIGFEYAAMNKIVINASLNNPHVAYDFNINPNSREEFTDILMNLQHLKHQINVNDVYEYYYMKHLVYNCNWLWKDFEQMTSYFNPLNEPVKIRQDNEDLYNFWIQNWSVSRHKEILNNLDSFVESGKYVLASK
jgi:hypothetical protein